MESKRIRDKPLVTVGGKALLHWTYERARKVADDVFIATSDKVVADYCNDSCIPLVMTSPHWKNGTQRCADAWRTIKELNLFDEEKPSRIINWQVDEPLLDVDGVRLLRHKPEFYYPVETICCPHLTKEQLEDRNLVKAIVTRENQCLWFSRAPMAGAWGHIGIYSFHVDILGAIAGLMPTSEYEAAESLEQLTWLEHGIEVNAIHQHHIPLSINTPLDVAKFREMVE
jgi:3-deoxy-manno-octulosonate cytidylyltransferase (CMP-KDO synthetase)